MKFAFLIRESLSALKSNPFRTLLTMLGVIIGVCAVIAMMSIGGGAKEESVREIQSLGANNLYVKSVELNGESLEKARQALSEGLSRKDLQSVLEKVPWIDKGCYEWEPSHLKLSYERTQPRANLVAVSENYFEVVPSRIKFGRAFSITDFHLSAKVVILGEKLSFELFGNTDPVGNHVSINRITFEIIGVLQNRQNQNKSANRTQDIKIGERERQLDVLVPFPTIIDRFPLSLANSQSSKTDPSYAELSTMILHISSPDFLIPARDLTQDILKNRHRGIQDFQIVAPVDLLAKSNKIQEIFNLVMIFIAGLSLIVGGIGIMNIMLANIQQRIKEIGIRRAIGATKNDILIQFLFEAIVISFGGGLLGIFSGILISHAISSFTGWTTVLSLNAISISFLVSVGVGLIFGIFPAKKASELDPIKALRYE